MGDIFESSLNVSTRTIQKDDPWFSNMHCRIWQGKCESNDTLSNKGFYYLKEENWKNRNNIYHVEELNICIVFV